MKKLLAIYLVLVFSLVGYGGKLYLQNHKSSSVHTNSHKENLAEVLSDNHKKSDTKISINLEHPLQDLVDNPLCADNSSDVLASIKSVDAHIKDHKQAIVQNNMPMEAVTHHNVVVSQIVIEKVANHAPVCGFYIHKIFTPPC